MGSSDGSCDGINYGTPVGSFIENLLKAGWGYGGIRTWSMKIRIRQIMCFNLA